MQEEAGIEGALRGLREKGLNEEDRKERRRSFQTSASALGKGEEKSGNDTFASHGHGVFRFIGRHLGKEACGQEAVFGPVCLQLGRMVYEGSAAALSEGFVPEARMQYQKGMTNRVFFDPHFPILRLSNIRNA